MKLLGVVLAGGESRRFGSDKARALIDGMALAEHARAALAPFVAEAEESGSGGIADRPAAGLGPLGGICGALHHARTRGYDAILTIGCDTPFVPIETLMALADARGAAFVADTPIIGRWPVALVEPLERHLTHCEDRSMRCWCALIGATPLDAPPIANINRPADLAALNPLDKARGRLRQ
ncbi:molybdenum cofactor guanylyltransferase [uncultured Sphingomonas sp.]|uniref:molybdenum cofactor guanylyltransferase n=1 Tax=uncultured Sphingomonas sp. TaxID=158754 RepID=UPI00262961D5|nr:molybdenum cofactor guanylyltransferase [uncultured Sphingomonas sp.]